MASRTPSRGRSSRGSSASSTNGSQQALVIGGIALAVVVALLFVMNSGGGEKAEAADKGAAPAPAAQPAAAKSEAAAPVTLSAAKAGKAPSRAAPALSQATLDEFNALVTKAKGFYNEGVKARTAGDNMGARDQQASAKDVLDEAQKLVAAQLLWQEEAQMEDWAQPAEYVTLEKLYAQYQSLTKKVRMGGGQ